MLTTYELTDGRHVTGDTDDIELMPMSGRMTDQDWLNVQKAVKAGRTVINLAHVTHIHKPSDPDIDRYRALGY